MYSPERRRAIIESSKEPEPARRFATIRDNVKWWNLRDAEGNDVGDLEPGAVFEVIGEDDARLRVAAWAHKSGFKEEV